MKTVEIHLPYFKQGDDLGSFLKECSPAEAFLNHAAMLECAVEQLKSIAAMINNKEVEVDADTQSILISGDTALMNKLIESNLANEMFDEDEEDEYNDE